MILFKVDFQKFWKRRKGEREIERERERERVRKKSEQVSEEEFKIIKMEKK